MQIIDTFQNRLKIAMEANNIKQVDLVEKTKLDKTLINKYLAGVTNARQRKLTILADALNVNEVWLMGYDVPMERTPNELKDSLSLEELYKDKVPLLGTVKAGYDYLANENVLEYVPISIKKEDNNYYALKIKGDSMETVMSEGDIVIIHKQEDFESGKICVILINGDEATVKKVYKLDDGIELVALNPSYPSRKFTAEDIKTIPVQIIGIVKQLIKNY